MDNRYKKLKESKEGVFDTFLCHNSEDKHEVNELFSDLLNVGILPWFDEEEVQGGSSIPIELDNAMSTIRSAVFIIGNNDLGNYQSRIEYTTLMMRYAEKKTNIVPIILGNTEGHPKIPESLKALKIIDFRKNRNPIAKLGSAT